jgi:hypothetical protein
LVKTNPAPQALSVYEAASFRCFWQPPTRLALVIKRGCYCPEIMGKSWTDKSQEALLLAVAQINKVKISEWPEIAKIMASKGFDLTVSLPLLDHQFILFWV